MTRDERRNLAVRITRDAMRHVRAGDPWIYDGSITSITDDGEAGDLAVIFDDKRKFAAIGLYDPDSPIQIKVLHAGAPIIVDADFWRQRVDRAMEQRSSLIADRDTTAYRLIHGENDAMPGLVVDQYAKTLVVKVYSPAWFRWLDTIVDLLVDRAQAERVVLRLGRNVQPPRVGTYADRTDGDTIVGEPPPGPILFRERGLTLEADVVHGQKTGHFLDQRDNRALVRSMAAGRSVLDVFASTGGFAVAAAAGGARSVHLVDLSAPAIEAARRNLAHNSSIAAVRNCAIATTVGDAFTVMEALITAGDRFDLVIVDPPSFAHSQDAIPKALNAYRHLARMAARLSAPGGDIVLASCSSRVETDEFATTVVDAIGRLSVGRFTETRRTGHAVDHPIGFRYGEYLKAVYLNHRTGGTRPGTPVD